MIIFFDGSIPLLEVGYSAADFSGDMKDSKSVMYGM